MMASRGLRFPIAVIYPSRGSHKHDRPISKHSGRWQWWDYTARRGKGEWKDESHIGHIVYRLRIEYFARGVREFTHYVNAVWAESKATRKHVDLYDADPNCEHDIETLWSGVRCKKCRGWFCY